MRGMAMAKVGARPVQSWRARDSVRSSPSSFGRGGMRVSMTPAREPIHQPAQAETRPRAGVAKSRRPRWARRLREEGHNQRVRKRRPDEVAKASRSAVVRRARVRAQARSVREGVSEGGVRPRRSLAASVMEPPWRRRKSTAIPAPPRARRRGSA